MAGRPPKSIEQHLADGTYRKDRHGDRIYDRPLGAIGEPPDGMTEEAVEIWRVTAEQLYKTLGESDRKMLESYCRWSCEALNALRKAEDEYDPSDRLKWITIAGKASNMANATAGKLGASPLDRQRIKGDPQSGEPDALDLLRQDDGEE